MTTKIGSYKALSVPADWSAEGNVKPLGKLSQPTQRSIEPVGAHFLAEARRVRMTIADDRLQLS
jgi:DnaJ family protein C protein 2